MIEITNMIYSALRAKAEHNNYAAFLATADQMVKMEIYSNLTKMEEDFLRYKTAYYIGLTILSYERQLLGL